MTHTSFKRRVTVDCRMLAGGGERCTFEPGDPVSLLYEVPGNRFMVMTLGGVATVGRDDIEMPVHWAIPKAEVAEEPERWDGQN